jgi:hypothetical protein
MIRQMISSQPPTHQKRKLDVPKENGQGPRAQTKGMMIMMNPHINGQGPQTRNGINQVVRKLVNALDLCSAAFQLETGLETFFKL